MRDRYGEAAAIFTSHSVLDATPGIRRGCIYDPRSMHFAVDDGRGRCIKSGGLSSRLVPPAVVNGGTIRAELSQSVEIDGIAPRAYGG